MPFGRRRPHRARQLELQAFRAFLAAGGAVAAGAGLHSAVAGTRSLPGRVEAGPEVDSEIRYYGAFYCAYGAALLRAASEPEPDPATVRALAAALLAGGLARAGGWLAEGPPHPVQRALLAIELTAPALLTAWQARLRAA